MAIRYYESPFHVTDNEQTAANMLMRARLMDLLNDILSDSGLTQAQAAELLGVTQTRISNLRNHKVEKFSLDCLVNFCSTLDAKVSLSCEPPSPIKKARTSRSSTV